MGLFSDIVASTRYRVPTAQLPAHQTITASEHGFEIGLPWPWFEVVNDESASGADERIAEIAAPRTSGNWPGAVFFAESSGVPIDEAEVAATARRLARQRGGEKLKPRRVLLGGVRGVDFVCDDGANRFHDLRLPVDESLTICMQAWLPSATADGYEVHLESLLASWRWLR